MKCTFCPRKTNGAIIATKPVCERCWYRVKNNYQKSGDIKAFYKKWIKEIPKKKN